MLNTLVNKLSIHNGLQFALFLPTLVFLYEYEGALKFRNINLFNIGDDNGSSYA